MSISLRAQELSDPKGAGFGLTPGKGLN
jgi:hypothetical protein